MRTFFPAQERGSRNDIQRPVSNQPPSRRRIPNVIRRRHLGFRHGRHQRLKAMCRHYENHASPKHRVWPVEAGFQPRSSITCGQFLPPAYRPAESRASGKSCPYRTSKAMCPPRMGPETAAQPNVARGTGFNIQSSTWLLNQATTWFRTIEPLYLSER